MTYEEMEMTIFGTNDNPIPGSWRDEAVKIGLALESSGNAEVIPFFAKVIQEQRQKMLHNIERMLVETQ